MIIPMRIPLRNPITIPITIPMRILLRIPMRIPIRIPLRNPIRIPIRIPAEFFELTAKYLLSNTKQKAIVKSRSKQTKNVSSITFAILLHKYRMTHSYWDNFKT